MSRENSTIDEHLWQKILKSKTVQGLAWKIEQAMQKENESRDLVKMLVEKWAELTGVRYYFPELKDVFTPEAVFCIEYARRQIPNTGEYTSHANAPSRVYDTLAYISNLVARHEPTPAQLKRMYNAHVSRWPETIEALPLFDLNEVEDGRRSKNKKRFVPSAAKLPIGGIYEVNRQGIVLCKAW